MNPIGVDHVGDAPMTRELWGAILYALRSDSPTVRERVAVVVEACGPRPWRSDLEIPGLLARRLVDIGLPASVTPPPGWEQRRPRITPDGEPRPRNPRA
jgi:hypothetical protein